MDTIEVPQKRRCMECGREITGRPDKKFCNRTCKNAYNNRLHCNFARCRKETVHALDRNYEILSQVLALGAKSARIEGLCKLGFSPQMVCSHRKGENGHNEYSCYDIVYHQTGMKIFNLRKVEVSRGKSPSVPHDRR